MFCYVILFCAFVYNQQEVEAVPGSPVVLVPGDGGSQFEAFLDKPTTVHVWCTQKTKAWFPLWLNLELMAPFVLDCLVDNMRMVYNPVNHTSSNSPGVQIRVPNFGNTSSVEFLDSSELRSTSYYYHLVEALAGSGYSRNKNIRGAPYDFRRAPNENVEFLKELKSLIEDAYYENSNTKVVLVGHSMGNPYLLTLLNQMSQAWKDKFVKCFICLSGPWGGAVKTIRLMASGDNLGVFVVNPLTARQQQRTMPSSAWLMPYPSFWNKSEVLVSGPLGNYTAYDYERFFKDINFTTGYDLRQDTAPITLDKLEAPGVEVHCLHGLNVSTPAKFHWTKKSWFDNQPDVTYGDGDGTVNRRSLEGCLRWQNNNHKKPVYHQAFEKVDHMSILEKQQVIDYILKQALKK